tara:strand:+ start:2879 stop:3418 length:540 start_codon:yes stop_codon:yes gene_type:complete
MANISDYKFHQLSDPKMDKIYKTEAEVENKQYNSYLLTSYQNPHYEQFAINHHLNFYNGNMDENPKTIEYNNSLMYNQQNTHADHKLSLNQRAYLTVPYLGRGKVNINVESDILMGKEIDLNKKSLNPSTEINLSQYSNYPLIPEIKDKMTNPKFWVESENDGWVRGGLPSRELNRDQC